MESTLIVNLVTEKSHTDSNGNNTLITDVSGAEQEQEINQNYLKHYITSEDGLDKCYFKKDSPKPVPVKENATQSKMDSNNILHMEEKTKRRDFEKGLCTIKKSSFMVSAILERPDPVISVEQASKTKDVCWSETKSTPVQLAQTQHIDSKKYIDEQVDFSSDKMVKETETVITSDYSSQTKSEDVDFCNNIVNLCDSQIADSDESSGTDKSKPVNFTRLLSNFTNESITDKNDQKRNFETTIDEIRKRKEDNPKEFSKDSQEKKVRKRKQERPQSISFKLKDNDGERNEPNLTNIGRKSKRKQNITKRYYRYDQDVEEDNSSEIKQTPLCSKLCSSSFRSNAHHQRTVVDSEENSQSEDSNIPCTTNRYRRHFLKQLRSAEAARSKMLTEPESTAVSEVNIREDSEDSDSDDDYFFDGKRVKMSEIENALDSNKCKVCAKEFSDIGTLMAHFICHSAIEKEQASLLEFQKSLSSSSTLESSTYFCHLCNQKFTNISLLQDHVLKHSANFTTKSPSTYECNLCRKPFATAGSLYLHKKIHTGDNPYTCTECNKQFRDKTRLTTHLRVHTGEKPFSCDICFKQFSQKGNLKLHQQKIHLGLKPGKNRCTHCNINFSDKIDLMEHLKKAHQEEEKKDGDSPVKAGDSDKTSSSKHSQQPNTQKDLKNKGLISSSQRKGHSKKSGKIELNDTELTQNSCTTDDVEDNSNSSVSENSSVIIDDRTTIGMSDSRNQSGSGESSEKSASLDGSKLPRFICPTCNLQFQTAKSFNEHLLSHVGQGSTFYPTASGFSMIAQSGSEFPSGVKKVYRCEECSLDFVAFPEFQSHLKSHKDNTSKVMCNICQKQMSSSNLLDHMRIHTGEKPYGCIHCGKLFRRSHHLQTHLRTHTGDRPYVCVDCGKTFARGDHLQNHRRTHTGEKPYKCETCEKSYSQSHHLLRHKRTHTGEKPYNCELCEKRFSRDHHLKKHMETHRVVIFTGEKDGGSQKYTNRCPANQNNLKVKAAQTGSTMATRASDRIAQLLSSSWYNNIASELMASMVQCHLQAEKQTDELNDKGVKSLTENINLSINTKENPNQTKFSVEDTVGTSKDHLVISEDAEEDEKTTKESSLKNTEKTKDDFAIIEETAASFLNPLRGIPMAKTLEEIVKQSLNEDDGLGKVSDKSKDRQNPCNS